GGAAGAGRRRSRRADHGDALHRPGRGTGAPARGAKPQRSPRDRGGTDQFSGGDAMSREHTLWRLLPEAMLALGVVARAIATVLFFREHGYLPQPFVFVQYYIFMAWY